MSGHKRNSEDFSDEIKAHIENEAQRLRDLGMSEAEAREKAQRTFGNVTGAQESFYESRRWLFWDHLSRDIRFALRVLRKSPGFTAVAVLTLALGIGANAAIFSLVRGILLRPLVNRDEDRIIYIRETARGIGNDNTTFSVPEIHDLKASTHTISEFGDFSVIGFTMAGLGEPREVRAGVVGGSFFDVMGLHPVLGRLLDARDDGPGAAGAVVLTYRFWTTALSSDPTVIGKTVRLSQRDATVVGVLEPSIPYPTETEIIANVVTSPHHLSATMVTGRVHRMTELFGRLAPGMTLEQTRTDLRAAYSSITAQHPEAYSKKANFQIEARLLRDQITAGARTILIVLMAASVLIFVIACSNVANLILARTVRRENELAVRAALGASARALRRTLLAESLLVCMGGAALGVATAPALLNVLARYASRYSVRALELNVDATVLWVGALLALIAAVLLAYVPSLPTAGSPQAAGTTSGGVRVTGSTNRRLRAFAVIQIAASFVLLAGASMLAKTLLAMQEARIGLDARRVLAINVPVLGAGKSEQQVRDFYKEAIRRVDALPGVDGSAFGVMTPWRDVGRIDPKFQFSTDRYVHASGEDYPRAEYRVISPAYFAALGVPVLEGRDFNALDGSGTEPVVIVSQSLAQRMFPGEDAIGHHVIWVDPVVQMMGGAPTPRRIIGIAADIDDTDMIPGPTLTIYTSIERGTLFGGRLFIHTRANPYSLVTPVTQTIRALSADQPVERAATLEDVRAEVLTPDRLNTIVFGVFAGVALAIALVGVAGVLAFLVSARTREFGIRLALGAPPERLLRGVIAQGAAIAAIGVAAGGAIGYALARFAGSIFGELRMPGALPVSVSAAVLLAAAAVASAWPAVRAARVDPLVALKHE
ncbi:MAG TPA: ADOP family duplicated permease [Candidatus Acidoferrales bacterium]|nr:ADOP family duplicated permease [Candidatus Acidoferrales bacterium]